jgi:signal transduction histidine kinase
MDAQQDSITPIPHHSFPQSLLGNLASTVSHEISNQFNAIFLYTDLLEEDLQQLPSHMHASPLSSLAEIKTEVIRLQTIAQDYFIVVRLGELTYQPEALEAVVQACGLEIQEVCARRGLTLHLEGLDHLGYVALHRSTIQRALSHLLHHAVWAMPAGGTLSIRGQREGGDVRLEICDTGHGIPVEALPLVCKPWHGTLPEETGLELYTAQAIVLAHGGKLTVQSVQGQGTKFTMIFPGVTGL